MTESLLGQDDSDLDALRHPQTSSFKRFDPPKTGYLADTGALPSKPLTMPEPVKVLAESEKLVILQASDGVELPRRKFDIHRRFFWRKRQAFVFLLRRLIEVRNEQRQALQQTDVKITAVTEAITDLYGVDALTEDYQR